VTSANASIEKGSEPFLGRPGMALPGRANLEKLLDRLEKLARPPDEEWFTHVAQEVAKVFRVQPDEVAVLELSANGHGLKFVLPEKLQPVGSIPLSSPVALAARTARERRSDIVNSFASSRHAIVFEGVPLGRRHGDSIHKIMSAPILREDKVIGVAQISRKGQSAADSGPDFTPENMKELQGLNNLLGRFLTLCKRPA
jgi:hypothetical protein